MSELETLYKRLYVSREDFEYASRFANFILKKEWHFKPWERRGSIYLQQSAFMTGLIIFYARPFTSSKGFPKFPEKLLLYNKTEMKLHKKILNLRHQVYAHSDASSYKIIPFSDYTIFGPPFFRLEQSQVKRLLNMIEKTMRSIEAELKFLITRIKPR